MVRFIPSKKIIRWVLPIFYGLFITFFIAFSFYHLRFAKKVIPGVYLNEIALGGKTKEQVLELVNQRYHGDFAIEARYLDKSYYIKSSDIGFSYLEEDTVKKAFGIGRSGGFFENNKTKILGMFKRVTITPKYQYSEELFEKNIGFLAKAVETEHNDSYFFINAEGVLSIKRESYGNVFNKEDFRKSVINRLDISELSPISIERFVYPYEPSVTFDDLKILEGKYTEYFNNAPVMTFKDNFWPVSGPIFTNMIKPHREGANLTLEVDKTAILSFLSDIAGEVDSPPKGEIFKVEGAKVIDFRLPTPGYSLKKDSAAEILSLALLNPNMERQISLPVETYLPSASTNSYGIQELLGEGYSKFEGSIPNRVQNIVLASRNVNGSLVAPGETFSFNKAVGPVDYAHGFTSAYIISKGRTVLGEGGGVCQVSTTLFRAILNAGLPTLSRTAHAYRVAYYEQDSVVGLDATVFQPTVDLSFKNDTENYLLIQSEVLADTSKMYFRVYGTSDGRVSKISAPVMHYQIPPLATVYQDDPTLKKGLTKQVDWSSWGASVEVKRVVEKNGKVLYDDVFKSYYQPWAAVYLVGTKE